jgi:hypothetical protein
VEIAMKRRLAKISQSAGMSLPLSETFTVTSDLVQDWTIIARAHLQAIGYDGAALADPHDATAALLNVQRHRVSPRPRRVHRSRELADLSNADLIRAIELGADLTPFQSRLHGPLFNDHLLNDWGIQHFHLVPSCRGRTDDLLFAWVTADDFYAIEKLGHTSAGHRTFDDQVLIEIVHRNWPDLLGPFCAPGVVPGSLSGPHTPEARKQLRAIGFTLSTQVCDGTVYTPPGGGVVMGGIPTGSRRRGLSWLVARQADRVVELLTLNQDALSTKGATFVELARAAGVTFAFTSPISLRLAYREGRFFVFHEASDVAAFLMESPAMLHTAGNAWLYPSG